MESTPRAYNMILTKKQFGHSKPAIYALLGLENGKVWNFLGGKQESGDKSRGLTASRELYEESAKIIDKRGDSHYWHNLPSYEWNIHKVFIHEPGNLECKIKKLDATAKLCIADKSLGRCFKGLSVDWNFY